MLYKKLEILKESNTISEVVYDKIMLLVNDLESKNIDLLVDACQTFIVHYAMAMHRNLKGEVVEAMDPLLIQEIENSEELESVKHTFFEIQKHLEFQLEDVEVPFIYLHLITLRRANICF